MSKVVTMSATGDVQLPKEFLEQDRLSSDDTFTLERLSPGQYLLQKQPPGEIHQAALSRSKNGLLVFTADQGPPITSELVKRLESES